MTNIPLKQLDSSIDAINKALDDLEPYVPAAGAEWSKDASKVFDVTISLSQAKRLLKELKETIAK